MTDKGSSPDIADINREDYRPVASPDRLQSVRNSLVGLWFMIRHEQSIQILSIYTIGVIAVALWVEIDALSFAVLLIPVGTIWVTECINTAIEATVDLITSELHPLAKVAKDVGSAATFLSALFSSLISLLLLGPPVVERFIG